MTTRRVRPITSPGAWEFEGGYRKRAEQSLALLEQKVAALRSTLATRGSRPTRPDSDAVDEIHALADSAVIFAAMAVESFLNLYGVIRLGEEFYARTYERLSVSQKVSSLLATCCGALLAPQDEILSVVARLFERRNALVHPKTREVKPRRGSFPKATPLLPAAREAVRDMRRFNELFLTCDTDAGKWWHV